MRVRALEQDHLYCGAAERRAVNARVAARLLRVGINVRWVERLRRCCRLIDISEDMKGTLAAELKQAGGRVRGLAVEIS